MQVIINANGSGILISPEEIRDLFQKKQLPCFFYTRESSWVKKLTKSSIEEINKKGRYNLWCASTEDNLLEINNKCIGSYLLEQFERNDPDLIEVLKRRIKKITNSYDCYSLKLVEIPDDVEFEIECVGYEDDIREIIREKHRVWE